MSTTPQPPRSSTGSFFETDHLQPELRGRSVGGAFATLAAQGWKFVLQIGSLWVLARILLPADFGLVGMVLAVTGLGTLFQDLGLSAATVQSSGVTHRQVSTLFWINAGFGAALAALTVALGPAIAWFYGEPRLSPVAAALGAIFLLGGLAVQHEALLRRQMRFRALALLDALAAAVGVAAALWAAFAGAGYWALVIQSLALSAARTAGVWVTCRWRPGAPGRGSGVRPMLRYGRNLTGFRLVNYLARNLDDVLIGRFWGAAALGLYGKAYALLMLPLRQVNAPVSGVAVPTLSRLQDQPERFRRYYLTSVSLLALATMPLAGLLFALSRPVILVVLGPRWIGAVGLFSVLALAAFVQPVVATGGWVYLSLGQTGRMARWGTLFGSLRCLSFLVGLPWGAMGVATAYTAATWILAVPSLAAALGRSPASPGGVLRATARPAVLGMLVAACAWSGRRALPGAPLSALVVGAAAGLAGGAVLVAAWPSLRREAAGLLSLAREVVRGSPAIAGVAD